MSNIDTPERDTPNRVDESAEARPARTPVSRRTLIKTAAGAGAAVAAAGIVGFTAGSATSHKAAGGGGTSLSAADAAAAAGGPIMVHLVDVAKGTVEVFTPTVHTQITDHDLATRIARAAGN